MRQGERYGGCEDDMKATMMEAVRAHLAAKEMSRQILPYTLALAMVKVKQATQAEMDCYAAEEQKLVEQYAARDESGNIVIRNGRFAFHSAGFVEEEESARLFAGHCGGNAVRGQFRAAERASGVREPRDGDECSLRIHRDVHAASAAVVFLGLR